MNSIMSALGSGSSEGYDASSVTWATSPEVKQRIQRYSASMPLATACADS